MNRLKDGKFSKIMVAHGLPNDFICAIEEDDRGNLWINSHNIRDLRTPFGGVKASGVGREGGSHSIDFFTESRIVHVSLADVHVPRFGASGYEAHR